MKKASCPNSIIWNKPCREIIMNYGNTADEMAVLCSEGRDGWLLPSHISWLLEKATLSQKEAICLCLPGPGPEELQQLFFARQG
ncbi:hypothetical protein PoB_007172600 [Plakobranchus ocellatus]|uniref:Uncharacterized protein n=1 Tax=Plakobranchus ocellatus TaxID=259542 RepID=A0AAV4DMP6_9GAST|nr:hypothetical protein PoB_007172600 [Plakobranchus ocellatus]